MPVQEVKGKIRVSTDQGDAVRANPDLAALALAPDKGAFVDQLPVDKQSDLLKAVLIKLDELEQRLAALEKRN